MAPKPTKRRIDAEVGHGAGQELARLPAVVEADVEALELGVEVVAQVRLQPGGQDGEQDRAGRRRGTPRRARSPATRAAQRRIAVRSPSASGPSMTCFTISGTATIPALDTIELMTMRRCAGGRARGRGRVRHRRA